MNPLMVVKILRELMMVIPTVMNIIEHYNVPAKQCMEVVAQ